MERKFLLTLLIASLAAISLILFNYFYLSKIVTYSMTIYIFSIFIFVLPIVVVKWQEHRRVKELEEMFPAFLRDFVEAVRGGMTVPQAFKSVSSNAYGSLTPYIKKMSSQLDWGIPVEKVLLKFSKESKSRLIGRIISSVMESHRFGGNLADTFEALSNTALEVERLRAERRLYMNSQMITGYIIFFVFLGVIIGLEKFLVPSLAQVSSVSITPGLEAQEAQTAVATAYKELFRNLILLQGLFAGLSIGKMAEGAIIGGLKHSLFMMFVGVVIFSLIG